MVWTMRCLWRHCESEKACFLGGIVGHRLQKRGGPTRSLREAYARLTRITDTKTDNCMVT